MKMKIMTDLVRASIHFVLAVVFVNGASVDT